VAGDHSIWRTRRYSRGQGYAFVVLGIVIAVDISRTVVLWRASRRYRSAALASNALHFASDLAGSVAVLVGLVLVHQGYARADSVAALFVAILVLLAAARLMQRNVDVLMDRAPADAEQAARVAIAGVEPPVTLKRLRMRQAGPRQFMDVVITVPPGRPWDSHAAADSVEDAASACRERRRRPSSRRETRRLSATAHAAALGVPLGRCHNVSVLVSAVTRRCRCT
jgi:cation diffusion facilitator family transporter